MKDRRSLKKWRSADGGPWKACSNRDITLRRSLGNLEGVEVKQVLFAIVTTRTRESPGEGFASVLIMTESFSAWWGFIGFSYVEPLTLTVCRTGSDHTPLPPPIAWSFLFTRVGRSRWTFSNLINGRRGYV